MAEKSRGYVNVQELLPRVSMEQAAAFYGVTLPELHRVGSQIRTRCFLNCGQDQTGDRAIAINAADSQKRWKCHSTLRTQR